MYPVSGLTGVGFDVPGATPGTGVGGLPDGSAVLVPGATGASLALFYARSLSKASTSTLCRRSANLELVVVLSGK